MMISTNIHNYRWGWGVTRCRKAQDLFCLIELVSKAIPDPGHLRWMGDLFSLGFHPLQMNGIIYVELLDI